MKGWKGWNPMMKGFMKGPWAFGKGKVFGKMNDMWNTPGKGECCGAVKGAWGMHDASMQDLSNPQDGQMQQYSVPQTMPMAGGTLEASQTMQPVAAGPDMAQGPQMGADSTDMSAYVQMMEQVQEATQSMVETSSEGQTEEASTALPVEKQLEVQQAAMAAQQAQLLQQIQFQTQNHQFETQQMAVTGELPARFKEGFRPLQLCKRNLRGSCPDADNCRFAHTLEELHPLSPDLPQFEVPTGTSALAEQVVDGKKDEPQYRIQKKRAMCNRLGRGGCLLGKSCPFAHSEDELGTTCRVLTGRVKAKLCKYWESNKCIYGKHCVNAHGPDEIGAPMPGYLVQPASRAQEQRPEQR